MMMVSLFPYDLNDATGIPPGMAVTIEASAVTWRTFGSIQAPVQPPAAIAPIFAGETYLVLSIAFTTGLIIQYI